MTIVPPAVADRLDSVARRALAEAVAAAELGQHGEVTPLHVLGALLPGTPELRAAVERHAADPRLLLSFVEVTLARRRRVPAGLRPVLDERLVARLTLAAARSPGLLGAADLASAALRCGAGDLEHVLGEFDLRAADVATALDGGEPASRTVVPSAAEPPSPPSSAAPAAPGPATGPASATAALPPAGTPTALEIDGEPAPLPWTKAIRAAAGRPAVVGRTAETASIVAVLRQRTVRSPFLVGPAGCGRRTVLAEVLSRLAEGRAGAGLPTIAAALDLVSLLAGTRARGDLEDRLTRLQEALRAAADRVLLCVPDASMLEAAAPGVGLDEILADLAERHGLRLALVGTPEDFERLRGKARRLIAAVEPVSIGEPPSGELGLILERHAGVLGRHHGVTLRPEALVAAADLSGRYLREPAQPARAIHLLDAVAARAASAGGSEVGADEVAGTVAAWTRIPVMRLVRDEADRLRGLEETLCRSVKGQDDAVARVARAVRRGRLGLRDPRRPIGSFLFAGPTGVGKTELARRLAEALFDDPASLIRVDMSEFREPHMVARLLGAPPGYKDSEEGGVLTEAIRRRPYSVLLLDEMEKAHGDVHNILLQLLDEGRLTDARGRAFDFTHCVVVMTTNVGGRLALEVAPGTDLEETLRAALLGTFRPEMLNRIDEIVIFRALDDPALRAIARLALDDAAALARPLGLAVEFAPEVDAWVVGRRDAPEFGARPVRRVVRREVLDRLAGMVLGGETAAGARVAFGVEGADLRVRVEVAAGGDGLRTADGGRSAGGS